MVVFSLISKEYDYIQYVYERSMKEKVPTKKQQKDLSEQKEYPPSAFFTISITGILPSSKLQKKD